MTHSGLHLVGFPSFEELCSRSDFALFHSVLLNPSYILHGLLIPINLPNATCNPYIELIPFLDNFSYVSAVRTTLLIFCDLSELCVCVFNVLKRLI